VDFSGKISLPFLKNQIQPGSFHQISMPRQTFAFAFEALVAFVRFFFGRIVDTFYPAETAVFS
jgi:hypothetical protein